MGQVVLLVARGGGSASHATARPPQPALDCFHQLGVHVAVGGAGSKGLVLALRMEAGRSVLRHTPHARAYHRRVREVSTLVTPL